LLQKSWPTHRNTVFSALLRHLNNINLGYAPKQILNSLN
jgi:hypothetical protein